MPLLIVLFNNSGYLSQKSGVTHHYPEGYAVKANHFAGTSIMPPLTTRRSRGPSAGTARR